jgi:phenylacetic acid degradation operon negative regulatory protein
LTLLGEIVLRTGGTVWTASLLSVLTGLGVSTATAGQAIARAAEAGWLRGEKRGRDVRWELDTAGRDLIEEITQRVQSLHTAPDHRDRNALILNITIPSNLASVRKRLYSRLSWAGFGNPAPGSGPLRTSTE